MYLFWEIKNFLFFNEKVKCYDQNSGRPVTKTIAIIALRVPGTNKRKVTIYSLPIVKVWFALCGKVLVL